MGLGAGGCSYRLESPHLPNEAGTLGLAAVRNRTFTGELDVRLQHRLRSLLLRHPGFQIGQPEHADLVLDVELSDLNVIRARDLASTNLTSVSYRLVGFISLYDRRSSQYYFNRQPVVSTSHQDFDTPVTETPAIRDEGLDDAVEGFARQVEGMLFYTF